MSFKRTSASSGLAELNHLAPPVDRGRDRLAEGPEILDRGEQLDQIGELAIEPHAITVETTRGNERVGNLKQLLGRQHGADGRPANDQANVVNATERRRVVGQESLDHLRHQRERSTNAIDLLRRLDLPSQLGPEGRGGILRENPADFVELQEVEGVSVHDTSCWPLVGVYGRKKFITGFTRAAATT